MGTIPAQWWKPRTLNVQTMLDVLLLNIIIEPRIICQKNVYVLMLIFKRSFLLLTALIMTQMFCLYLALDRRTSITGKSVKENVTFQRR